MLPPASPAMLPPVRRGKGPGPTRPGPRRAAGPRRGRAGGPSRDAGAGLAWRWIPLVPIWIEMCRLWEAGLYAVAIRVAIGQRLGRGGTPVVPERMTRG